MTEKTEEKAPARMRRDDMRVAFKAFRATRSEWEDAFEAAASFATGVGRERLISITHADDGANATATVWFWSEDEEDWPRRKRAGTHRR